MGDNLPVRFDADLKHRFLTVFGLCGQLQRAAKETGISPSTVRAHLKDDLDFKEAYEEARNDFNEQIEREALRRAVFGWEEPVYQQGVLAGTVRKYDSRLLELVLKRTNPEYKESFTVDHNVSGGILVTPQIEAKDDWEKRHAIEAEVIEPEEQDDETAE